MSEKSFYIHVVNRDHEFECRQNQALLIGMESRNGKSIRVGCRGGGCGICKIKVITGDYESKAMSRKHISAEEQQAGFALACRVFPRSNLVVEADHYQPVKANEGQRTAAMSALNVVTGRNPDA